MNDRDDKIVMDGVTYWRLYSRCPICLDEGFPVAPTFWQHKQCDGDIYIGNNAKLYCEKCGWSIHLNKAKFNCPNHCKCDEETIEPSTRFRYNNPDIGRIATRAGIPWLKDFLLNYDE